MPEILISKTCSISESNIRFEFMKASGPGGQNINKVNTAVRLRFDMESCSALLPEVRQRLRVLGKKRVTEEGILIIEAKRFRSQEKNRVDALERLVRLLQKALIQPQVRKKTKPSAASQRKRLDQKRHRAQIKKNRNFDQKTEIC
ncbi:MAG: aminoacyl-tRNA hydrolase [SAR324 cluster bacterium]|nr:aminoacyl-tRNA hydrolase [SAR324 cluster bacterium]